MDGWWDCPRLDELFHRILGARLDERARPVGQLPGLLAALVLNPQSRRRAFRIGRHHYDLGNELYRRMLDRRMIYSCGYWRGLEAGKRWERPSGEPDGLDEAQEVKLDLVCRKLGLEKGMRVLDVGCGWGGTLLYAAERFGVEGVGITVSERQVELGRELCRNAPVELLLEDYRDLHPDRHGRFDRVLSLGMFEHVGRKNHRRFLEVVRGVLPEDGLFLLHTIGHTRSVRRTDPWIDRYIFPNSLLPSPGQVARAQEGLFVLEDWHSFGAHYDPTLMAWHRRFEEAWRELSGLYDDRFRRMWRYYLLACAGSFRARRNQLWQLVLSPRGVAGGYRRAS